MATPSSPPLPSHAPTPGIDYAKRYFVLTAIAMGIFLGTIDASIVNAALPTLVDVFDTSFAAVQWVVLGYLLTLATLVLGIGRLGDMLGKKRIYTAGFGLFTLCSVLAGLSPSVGWLIAFRVLQALGASMIFALGFAIVTEAVPPTERGRALGLMGTMVSIGIVVGPALGGVLVDNLSWRWIFFVNLPIGAIGTWTAARYVPDIPPPRGQRFDVVGAATFFAGLLSLMFALTLAQELTFSSPAVLALFAAAAALLTVFIQIERRIEQPMLDLGLFRNRLLSVNLITGWISFVAIAGLLFLLPFYLQDTLGFSPQQMGLMLGIGPAALGIMAPLSGSLSDRIGPRPVTVLGLAVLTAGYAIAITLGEGSTVVHYTAAALPIGAGMGIFQSPNNSAVLGSVPRERLGVTSGMLTITRNVGQLVGISVLGTLWAARVTASIPGSNPTDASPASQVSGLRQTMVVVTVLVALALALAAWGWWKERTATGGSPGVVTPRGPA